MWPKPLSLVICWLPSSINHTKERAPSVSLVKSLTEFVTNKQRPRALSVTRVTEMSHLVSLLPRVGSHESLVWRRLRGVSPAVPAATTVATSQPSRALTAAASQGTPRAPPLPRLECTPRVHHRHAPSQQPREHHRRHHHLHRVLRV